VAGAPAGSEVATDYDSSAVLEVLLGGPRARDLATCWEGDPLRLASVLLEAESVAVLARLEARRRGERARAAMRKRLALLEDLLEGMLVREVDAEVLEILRRAAPYTSTRRSRSAFEITETELKLMAAAAIMGFSSRPVHG